MRTLVYTNCRHCLGEGRTVHGRGSEMLRLIHETPWISTPELAKKMRIGGTNASNVAALLADLDLVERRGSGSRHSPYQWRVKKP